MEQIVLNTNLRFIIAGLSVEQKGMLLTALLEGSAEKLAGEAFNLYQYIFSLQQEIEDKKQRMRDLNAKRREMAKQKSETGVQDDLFAVHNDDVATQCDAKTKRKVTKEKNYNKIKKIIFSEKKQEEKSLEPDETPFVPPLVDEVRAFVVEEGLLVEPETFVDFYDSRGWKVGRTAIKNWQATVRLWHRRAVAERGTLGEGVHKDEGAETVKGDSSLEGEEKREDGDYGAARNDCKRGDEQYWHELMGRVEAVKSISPPPEKPQKTVISHTGGEEKLPVNGLELSPFARFMRRIEDNDILPENKNE
ncbi:MAG: hypothetical protein NC218_08750 [Acetobacter sp.]|nr:hypothetical protein [Acetobacter sp.]